MTDKNLIKIVNKDLKSTCQKYKIPFNIKSRSFRVKMITNLLKVTSVQKAASIIDHTDIRSTMTYNRYALTKNEIQELLDNTDSINKYLTVTDLNPYSSSKKCNKHPSATCNGYRITPIRIKTNPTHGTYKKDCIGCAT